MAEVVRKIYVFKLIHQQTMASYGCTSFKGVITVYFIPAHSIKNYLLVSFFLLKYEKVK